MTASAVLPLSIAVPAKRRDWTSITAIILACAIFAGLSAYLGVKSESDLEIDATTHYLFARYAVREHHYFASVWGRPLCTGAYAAVAWIGTPDQGRLASRLMSLAMALGIVATTYAIGKRQGYKNLALVPILLLAQPIFFLHSFSELTEIPFALVLMLAFLAYQRKQWLAMAILTGLLPLGRPEGFGFIMMAAAALVVHRRSRWLPVLAVPFFAWGFAGYSLLESEYGVPWTKWIFHGRWCLWVLRNWPYSYKSTYGSGNLFSFVARLPVLVSPIIFPFTLIGLILGLKRLFPRRVPAEAGSHRAKGDVIDSAATNQKTSRGAWLRFYKGLSHEQRIEIWIVLIPLSILCVHSLIWWRGLMGSNGELRYLVIVGPFFALAAARGWEWAFGHFGWTRPVLWAGVAALLPITANYFYVVMPMPLYEDGYLARETAQWYRSDAGLQADFPRIMATPAGIAFELDLSQTDGTHMITCGRQSVADTPPGVVLVWHPDGQYNASAEMCVSQAMIEQAGWIHFKHFDCGDRYYEVYLSPKTMSESDTLKTYQGD